MSAAVHDRFDLYEQPGARPAEHHNAELVGAPAQDSDQIIDRLPGQITRQFSG